MKTEEPKKSKPGRSQRLLRRLIRLVRLRFVEGLSTGELMQRFKSSADRRCLVAVALLDVGEAEFQLILRAEPARIREDLVAVRSDAARVLRMFAG
jgi:hypothetical protein